MNEKVKGLIELAHQHGTLKEQYEKAVRLHIDQAEVLPLDEFWALINELADGVTKALKWKRSVKGAITEFVRGRLFDEKHSAPPSKREEFRDQIALATLGHWSKLISFTRSYRKVKTGVSRIAREWTGLDMGDDGFSDFVDSMILGGKTKVELITSGTLTNFYQVKVNLFQHPLEQFILTGENYVEMTLGDALAEYGPSVARDFFTDDRGDALESVENLPDPGVVRGVDLQAILNALTPIMQRGKPVPGDGVQVLLTTAEYVAATNVIAMLQLADLVNYKRAQDAYPRVLQALKLVLAVADNPGSNPGEKISLAPKTRAQLDSALKFAEKG